MNQRNQKKPLQWLGLLVLAISLQATAAAGDPKGRMIQIGDKCVVDYSCKLKDGSLLITTLQKVAEDPKVPKSDLFVPLQTYMPVELMAGFDAVDADPGVGHLLLGRLDKMLSEAIVGREVGKSAEFELASGAVPLPENADSELRMKILRLRPIERSITLELFKRLSKDRAPAVGMEILLESGAKQGEPGLMGRVSAIEGDTIKVKTLARPGDTVQTPFGPGKVERYRDDNLMEIRLQPIIGKVLRFGNMLGRITKFDDTAFTIDMSNPFGGETLQCKAVVLDADSASPEKKALIESMRSEMEEEMARQFAAAKAKSEPENPGVVQFGDLIGVQYKIVDEKGRTWFSLFPEDADAMAKQVAAGAVKHPPLPYFPMVAGRPTDVPGLDLAVLGLQKGVRKSLTLTPAKGFGQRDDKLLVEFERARKVPLKTTMERTQFEQQFKNTPVAGSQMDLPPYGLATILSASDQEVTFALKTEKRRLEQPYGVTDVYAEKDNLIYNLTPRVGALYTYEDKQGPIVNSNDKTFFVDFNHPLAGQTVTVEFLVRDMHKASTLAQSQIQWVENLETARATARKESKPIMLVLYADWCHWCERLLTVTLTDPVITSTTADRFVWVKLNSDRHKEFKSMFGQEGFPMTVLLDPQGQVIEKHEGYQEVYPIWERLQNVLESKKG
jgi:FKBP-type peptidyl-prolyl cis-trans isomerase 2